MPGVIRALTDSGTPFSILTKGTLLRRDIPLLATAAADGPGRARRLYGDLGRRPARRPRAGRADAAGAARPGRAITDAGLPCGVFLAPVLPGLTDGQSELDAAIGAIAAAGATGVTVIPLHLRPGAREWFIGVAERRAPGAGPALRAAVRPAAPTCRPSTAPGWRSGSRRCWQARAGPAVRAVRPEAVGPIATGVPGDEEVGFPAGSLPTGGMPGVRPKGEMPPGDARLGRRRADVPRAAGACSDRRGPGEPRQVGRGGGCRAARAARPAPDDAARGDRRRARRRAPAGGRSRRTARGRPGPAPRPCSRRDGRGRGPQVLRGPDGVLGEGHLQRLVGQPAADRASPAPARGAAPAAPTGCRPAPGSAPRTVSQACQAVSAPGTAHSPSSVEISSRRAVACTWSRRSERNGRHRRRPAEGERAPGHRPQVLRVLVADPGQRAAGRAPADRAPESAPAAAPCRRSGRPCCTAPRWPASSPRAAVSGSRPVSPSWSGPRPSSRAASASRRHCASYPGGASSRRQARAGGGAGMSGSGCCHPPRMTEYYRYPQQTSRFDLSSPAERPAPAPSGRHRSNRGSRGRRSER